MSSQPVVLLWDIETSLMKVSTFTLYPERLSHQAIIEDWHIISASWKFLGKSKVYAVSGLDDEKRFNKDHRDDYHVVKTLRDVLENVDIIVGHNQDKFDIKKFNARLIFHRLPPLPKLIHSVDTLKEVKKTAAFTSNRLDYLTTHLCGEGKATTSPNLWMRAMNGDKTAITEMVKYNKKDVKILEQFYLVLLPYMKTHPHVGAMKNRDKSKTCNKCGSYDNHVIGTRYTASGVKRSHKHCNNCQSYFIANAA